MTQIVGEKKQREYEKPILQRPVEYSPSYANLGIVAQPDRLMEIRAPHPDDSGEWQRIYLSPTAAQRLLEWLPKAVAMQWGEIEEP